MGRIQNARYRARNKAYSLQQKVLRGCCEYCGLVFQESKSHLFHWAHKEQSDKKSTISKMVALGRGLDDLVREIKKCRLLCSNCHMDETHQNKHYLYTGNGNEIVIDRNADQLELDL
jgi:5-methylcytosine-specific restriction endonuclease McrA